MIYECTVGNVYCTESQRDVVTLVIRGFPQSLVTALTVGERSDGIRNANKVLYEAQLNRSRNACLNGEGVCCSSPTPFLNQL